MPFEVLDPTYGEDPAVHSPAPRLSSLDGATVGIISNGKMGTVAFFDEFERELVERHGVAEVVRVVKSNYSAPAAAEIMDRAKAWNALVAGIGD